MYFKLAVTKMEGNVEKNKVHYFSKNRVFCPTEEMSVL